METRFCKFCNIEHLLTKEYWDRLHYSPKCKTRKLAMHKEWKKKNPGKYPEYASKYYKNNKEKVIKSNYLYAKKRRKTDISYNLTIVLRQRINKALRKGWKVGSAVQDLGCSIDEFRIYLESKFSNGMSWENYGKGGWHIDHIRPLSSFDLTNQEQFQTAVHYTNLQPLWEHDNCSKSNKWSA